MQTSDLFALYKLLLYKHIDEAFGWDEHFQKKRFVSSYRGQDFYSVALEGLDVGYAILKNQPEDIHLSLLLLRPAHQQRGIGQSVMKQLMTCAVAAGRCLTLSCFLSNQRAMEFYQKLGFSAVTTDEHFVKYQYPLFDGAPASC